jgi:hypothetical protein
MRSWGFYPRSCDIEALIAIVNNEEASSKAGPRWAQLLFAASYSPPLLKPGCIKRIIAAAICSHWTASRSSCFFLSGVRPIEPSPPVRRRNLPLHRDQTLLLQTMKAGNNDP